MWPSYLKSTATTLLDELLSPKLVLHNTLKSLILNNMHSWRHAKYCLSLLLQVQISSLTGPKDETGYYESIASVTIGNEEKRQHDSTNM